MHPKHLEELFRDSPLEFASAFEKVYRDNPGSQILEVWKARLDYKRKPTSFRNGINSTPLILILIFLSGIFLQLPISLDTVRDEYLFIGTFVPGIMIFATSVYFISLRKFNWKILLLSILLITLSGVYLNLGIRAYGHESQVPFLVILHIGFFMWAILGLSYIGKDFRCSLARAEFLSITGEMIIYGAIISACFGIFGGLFMVLFKELNIEITKLVFEHIYLFAPTAIILAAAAFATSNFGIRKMVPYLAKIFSPLVLISLLIFLFAMILSSENPYENRDFLLFFNIVLIAVLAILFFVITERRGRGYKNLFDYINLILAIVAVLIDLITLSAIIYRLALYQLTPNRLAAIGANLLIFINLIGIIINYFKFIRGRAPITDSIRWLGKYLPVYAAWFAIVAFLFPLFFGLY